MVSQEPPRPFLTLNCSRAAWRTSYLFHVYFTVFVLFASPPPSSFPYGSVNSRYLNRARLSSTYITSARLSTYTLSEMIWNTRGRVYRLCIAHRRGISLVTNVRGETLSNRCLRTRCFCRALVIFKQLGLKSRPLSFLTFGTLALVSYIAVIYGAINNAIEGTGNPYGA